MGVRILLIAVGVLAVLVAVAPIGMGFVVEREYRSLIAEANESVEGLRVTGTIERGLWSSPARTTLEIEDPSGVSVVVLRHVLAHGPIPLGEIGQGRSPIGLAAVVVDTRYDPDPQQVPRVAAALDGEPLLRLIVWLHFDRSLHLRVRAPALDLGDDGLRTNGLRAEARLELDGDGDDAAGWLRVDPVLLREGQESLSIDGMAVQFSVKPDGEVSWAEGTFQVGAVETTGAIGSLLVSPTSGRYTSTLLADRGVGSGEAALVVDAIALGNGSGDGAAARRLQSVRIEESWRLDPESGLRAFDTTIEFERWTEGSAAYGPGRIAFAVRNLDSLAASAFREEMRALDVDVRSETELEGARRRIFAEWMPRLFASSPELVIEQLSVASPGGELTGRGRVTVDGSEPELLADPLLLWMQTRAELDLRVPAPMLHALLEASLIQSVQDEMADVPKADLAAMAGLMREGMVAQLVGQGLLVAEGDGYRIDFRLADGMPQVNGQLIDPSRLPAALGTP